MAFCPDPLPSLLLPLTCHEEEQPVPLQVKGIKPKKRAGHDIYAGPSTRRVSKPAKTQWMKLREPRGSFNRSALAS
jgi:hypothetical protein